MPPEAPKLDTRTYDDLVDQVETLAEATTPWRRAQPGESLDFGGALIRIFGRMMERTIARLNQVPEKNFLAFLDLLGTQILPPKPARVPLTFELAKGRNAPTVIPAGTRVAATLTAEETDDILFETEQALVATPAQVVAAYVIESRTNRYASITSISNLETTQNFSIFEGNINRDQSLYLDSPLFGLNLRKSIRVIFVSNPPPISLSISAWDETTTSWNVIESGRLSGRVWSVGLIQEVTAHPIGLGDDLSFSGFWIKLSLDQFPSEALPLIERIEIYLDFRETNLDPDHVFSNDSELDISRPFYPFGLHPKFNDTFYIAHDQAFSYPRNQITLHLDITGQNGGTVTPSDDLEVIWEVLVNDQWQPLSIRSGDENKNLTRSGEIVFDLPNIMGMSKFKNKASGWLRARIIQGNYGLENTRNIGRIITRLTKPIGNLNSTTLDVASARGFMPKDLIQIVGADTTDPAVISTVNTTNNQVTVTRNLRQVYPLGTIVQLQGGVNPPLIQNLTIEYRPTLRERPAHCLSSHDLTFIDHTPEAQTNQPFQPFQAPPDESPAFYMGFDRPLGTQPITLFIALELVALEPPPDEADSRPKTDARLLWDYKTPEGWRRLSLIDGTKALSESGLLTFLPPPDLAQTIEFGQLCYWIRVRWVEGVFQAMPHLRRLLTNTVWATQAVATAEEILGSSNGEPDQIFQTAQTPVLLGQTLFVRERELPAPAEALALRRSLGPAAIQPIEGVGGDRQGAWVQWQAVPDFYGSNGGDRHYILDYLTGQISFGNDQAGRVPPQGRNNIRLSYRTGGGSQGNCPADNILQLKSTVPYIKGVTNLEPARGGADAESLEQVKQRGPKQIRHRFRAVTVQDYEDLAYEASSEVARARAFPPRSYDLVLKNPLNRDWITPGDVDKYKNRSTHPEIENVGEVEIIIVPDSPVPQPIPSLDLINQVKTYLLNHSDKVMTLNVRGPIWIRVTITVDIVPTSLQTAVSLDTRIIDRLNEFLHPLTGGMDRLGWAFGRRPQDSDIYALLGSVAGVDHVRRLNMIVGDASESRLSAQQFALVFSGQHQVNLSPLEVNR